MYNCKSIILIAVLLTGLVTHAQTAAELLQKGIYTQETLGDLDAAIRIYQQVVAQGSEARAQAAQAQFRLAQCLLRKGSTAEATKAFEKLIADYPEHKELVAAARQQNSAGLKLIPPPWTEGEMLRLKLKLPGGMPIGLWVQSVEKSSGNQFVMTSRTHVGLTGQFSRSENELEGMKPKASYFRHTMLGEYKLTYGAREVKVESNGKEAKPIEYTRPLIDNEAAVATIRRLPLTENYKAQLEIMNPMGSAIINITAEVAGVEEIATAAGKFRTFKVELSPLRQTFWISADSRRYVVKMDVNGAIGELEEITRADSGVTSVKDETQRVSINLPSGWLHMKLDTTGYFNAAIFDPEAKCHCMFWAGKFAKDARSEMVAKTEDRPKNLKNYKVRSDSWTPRQVNGAEAVSVLADFEQFSKPMAEYVTILKQGEIGIVLFARVAVEDLAAFRPQFDKIIESVQFQ